MYLPGDIFLAYTAISEYNETRVERDLKCDERPVVILAGMAELADARDLKSRSTYNRVPVRSRLPAAKSP